MLTFLMNLAMWLIGLLCVIVGLHIREPYLVGLHRFGIAAFAVVSIVVVAVCYGGTTGIRRNRADER